MVLKSFYFSLKPSLSNLYVIRIYWRSSAAHKTSYYRLLSPRAGSPFALWPFSEHTRLLHFRRLLMEKVSETSASISLSDYPLEDY